MPARYRMPPTFKRSLIVEALEDAWQRGFEAGSHQTKASLREPTGPQLMRQAAALISRYAKQGVTLSGNRVAHMLDRNQSYISKLLRILHNAPQVADLWAKARNPLAYEIVLRISELPSERQLGEYTYQKTLAELQSPKASPRTREKG